MESGQVRTDTIEAYIRERTQIDGTITLEDDQEDIERIVSIDARFIPDSAEVVQDGVEVTGRVVFGITYVSTSGSVEAIEAETTFTKRFEAPGAKPGMDAIFSGSIGSVTETLQDPRTISLCTQADMMIWIVDTDEMDVLMPGQTGVQTQTEDFNGVSTVEKQTTTFTVSEEADLPHRALPIGNVISTTGYAVVRDVTGTDAGSHVDGDLIVNFQYNSEPTEENPESNFQATSLIIPFSTDIPWEQRGLGENADVNMTVQSIAVTPLTDEFGENTRAKVDAAILLEAELLEDTNFTAVTDAYIPGRQSAVQTESIELRKRPKSGVKQRTMRFTVTLPAGYPAISEVLNLSIRPVTDVVLPVENGAQVRGTNESDIIYRSDGENSGIYGFHASVPFEETVPITCDGVMNAKAWAEQAIGNAISCKEVDCKVILNLFVNCEQIENMQMVTGIRDVGQSVDDDYAVVMTVASEGDTLWNVAKRFGATIDEVVRINPYLSDRGLKKGDRVMLYRRFVP